MTPRSAVVLAAGLGKRFRSDENKLLAKIFGHCLIEYPVRSTATAGLHRFVVVTNSFLLNKLGLVIESVKKEMGLEVEFVVNNEVHRGNAYSLILGLARSREVSLITVADHVYPSTLVQEFAKNYRGESLAIGGDRNPRYVDVAEATLVKVDSSGFIERVSKGLTRWNYVDVGIHVVSPRLLSAVEQCGSDGELANLYECFSKRSRGVVVDITGRAWKDVDTWADYLSLVEGSLTTVAWESIESWRK